MQIAISVQCRPDVSRFVFLEIAGARLKVALASFASVVRPVCEAASRSARLAWQYRQPILSR